MLLMHPRSPPLAPCGCTRRRITSEDLFVFRASAEPVVDKWLVWGFVDDPADRAPLVHMYGASAEVHKNGGKR